MFKNPDVVRRFKKISDKKLFGEKNENADGFKLKT